MHPIDPTSTERLAAGQAGYPLVAPAGLPAGYRPTSARTDAEPRPEGRPVTLQIGYVTPSQEFAGFVVSDDLRADAVTSVLDGAAEQGTVDLAGTPWTRSTNARGETVLSRRAGDRGACWSAGRPPSRSSRRWPGRCAPTPAERRRRRRRRPAARGPG